MTDRERAGWKSVAVGCHYQRGDYFVSTISDSTRSGYILHFRLQQLGEFLTWDEVQRLAERRKSRIV